MACEIRFTIAVPRLVILLLVRVSFSKVVALCNLSILRW